MANSLPLYEDDMTGDTTARGYGWQHQSRRARWAPLVAAGQVCCMRCGQPIIPGTPWDLGHDDHDRTVTTGPDHRACNRAAAARKTNATRQRMAAIRRAMRERW